MLESRLNCDCLNCQPQGWCLGPYQLEMTKIELIKLGQSSLYKPIFEVELSPKSKFLDFPMMGKDFSLTVWEAKEVLAMMDNGKLLVLKVFLF